MKKIKRKIIFTVGASSGLAEAAIKPKSKRNRSFVGKGLVLICGIYFCAICRALPPSDTRTKSLDLKVIDPEKLVATEGPAENFTGHVKVKKLVQGESPSNLTYGSVEFEPGAHSAWHSHPKGQLLIIKSGSGLVQEWGKPVRKLKTGDVVWTPPNIKHWHGASPTQLMVQDAITESADGKVVEWMEKVSDQQYYGKGTAK